MKEYDIVLAAPVRESLLELEVEARDELAQAIWDELRQNDIRMARLADGVQVREIGGYLISYRALNDSEKKRFEVRTGHLVVKIAPLSEDSL